MTKEVLLSISGIQYDIDQNDPIKMVTVGDYYQRNGKHFVLFDECAEGERDIVKNTLKLGPGRLELTRKGSSNVHMIFEEGKTNRAYYDTPIGSLLLGITTESIRVQENEEHIDIKTRYSLDVNCTHVSDCEINMQIQSKDLING